MDFETLNKWLTLVANIAILGGLIFLALEIQQNTAVTRSASAHEIADSSLDFFMRVAESPNLANLVKIANEDPSRLSDVEVVQYQYLTGAVFMLLEGAYKQYQLGFLSEKGWKPYEKLIENFLANPVSRAWWASGDTIFSPEFEALVIEITGVKRNSD